MRPLARRGTFSPGASEVSEGTLQPADDETRRIVKAPVKVALMEADRARELLAAERARIEAELARIERDDEDERDGEFDAADQAADLYEDELDEGRLADLRDQLAAVERAEERLAAGTYGLSVESGVAIPDERLEARPTAELTADEERAQGR